MSNTSFDKIIDKVFDGFKKITPALVAVWIASSFLLVAPERLLKTMNLDNMGNEYKMFCGFLFVFSSAIIISITSLYIGRLISRTIKNKAFKKSLKKVLLELTDCERKLVRLMYHSPGHSMKLFDDCITSVLLKKGIIVNASNVKYCYSSIMAFVLNDWVVDYLNRHPSCELCSKDDLDEVRYNYYRRFKY